MQERLRDLDGIVEEEILGESDLFLRGEEHWRRLLLHLVQEHSHGFSFMVGRCCKFQSTQ